MIVAVNEFVKRQTKFSGKTYSEELSFDFFARHAEQKIINNDFKGPIEMFGVNLILSESNDFTKIGIGLKKNTNNLLSLENKVLIKSIKRSCKIKFNFTEKDFIE